MCTRLELLNARNFGAPSSATRSGGRVASPSGVISGQENGVPIGRPLCRVGVRWVSVDTLSRSKNTSVGRQGKSIPHKVPLATGKSEPQRPSDPVPSGARGGAGARRNLKRPSPVVYSSPVHAKRCTRRANPGALPLGGLSLSKGEPRTPTREPDTCKVGAHLT